MPLFKHPHRESRGEPAPVAKLRNLLEQPNRLFNRRSIADLGAARSRSGSPHSVNTAATDERVVQRVKIPINGDATAHNVPHANGLDVNTLDLTLKPTPPTPAESRSITPPAERGSVHSAAAPAGVATVPPNPAENIHSASPDPPTQLRSATEADDAVPKPAQPVQNGGGPAPAANGDGDQTQNVDADASVPPPDQLSALPERASSLPPPAGTEAASTFPVPAKGQDHSNNITQPSQPEAGRQPLSVDTQRQPVEDAPPRASMDTAGFKTPQSVSPTSSGAQDVFVTPRRSLEPSETQPTFSAIGNSSEVPPAPPPLSEFRRPSLTTGERQRRMSAMSSGSTSPISSPRRMSAVLHSPPMPQPIANLPTLGGLSRAGPSTPGWGALALEGGPKSPQIQSPTGTAPSGGFPFFASGGSPSTSRNNSKDLSDAEVRKATKSMVRQVALCLADKQPVMFRMPSHHAEDLVDGGEAEDDDDEDLTSSEEGGSTPTTQPTLAHSQQTTRGGAGARGPLPSPVAEGESEFRSPNGGVVRVLHADSVETSPNASSVSTPSASNSEWRLNLARRQNNASNWVSFPTSPAARTPRADNYFESQPLGAMGARQQSSIVESPETDDTPSSTQSTNESTLEGSHEGTETEGEDRDSDYDDRSLGESGATSATSATQEAIQTPPSPSVPMRRPSLYSQTSQSMFNLQTPAASAQQQPPLPSLGETVPEWAKPPPTPAAHHSPLKSPQLKRRLSAGDADPPPPMYEPLLAFGAPGPAPRPRDEEGREKLPGYWCGVHIEGTLSRKMEFIQPGVQAKDRGWKKFYFVLHGTALYVYKFDPTKVPLRQGEPYLTCSSAEAERFLHVHLAPEQRARTPVQASPAPTPPPQQSHSSSRRNTVGLESAIGTLAHAVHSRRSTVSSSSGPPARARTIGPGSEGPDAKNPDLFNKPAARRPPIVDVASSTASAPIASHLPFAHNVLLHVYSLTGAESGLAADYKKRLHCVRVRAEGQQFMLQMDTARQCVQWIEAFQAATNVAMDLDVRPMPIQHTLPRRRRRARRPQPAAADPSAPPSTDNANDASFADTPEGNIAAVEAAERAQRERDRAERDRERMLEEDQANAGQPHGGLL